MTALWGLGIALLAGCEPSQSVKSGAPVVLSFGPVSAADGSPIEAMGGATGKAVPPLTNFLASFDRLLDAASLEDETGHFKAGLAQAQSTVGQVVALATEYVPNGDSQLFALLPPGPTLTVQPLCGLPTSSTVQVNLDLTKLRSHDRSTNAVAAIGVETALAVTTEPFLVTTDVPPPTDADPVAGTPGAPAVLEDPAMVFNVTFNTITPGPAGASACHGLPSAATHIRVTAQVGADPVVPIAAVVDQDILNPSHWTVSPPGTTVDGPGSWPAGAVVTITIDANTTDSYGAALGTPTNASFMVKS
jgi:hypothetical protein